jgi:hypothetical protein
MRWLLILLLLNGCSHGPLVGSGEIAPTPAGHAKLCKEQPTFPGCPKSKQGETK